MKIKSIHFICFIFLVLLGCQKIEVLRVTKVFTENIELNSLSVSADGIVVDVSEVGGTSYGHCWSTVSFPTTDDHKTVFDSASAGTYYTSQLNKLQFNTTYYIRSYTESEEEIIYGIQDTIKVTDYTSLNIVLNELNIQGEHKVNIKGMFTGVGSVNLEDYGVCYRINDEPTINDSLFSLGELSRNIALNENISNLLQETHYKFRLYAVLDNQNILYSNNFATYITDLHVTTHNSYITNDSIILAGAIDSLGVLPITDHGHCWSYLTSNPTINDERISSGPTTTDGPYISAINSLNGVNNISVYYRAYAIKNNVIVYGEIKSFDL